MIESPAIFLCNRDAAFVRRFILTADNPIERSSSMERLNPLVFQTESSAMKAMLYAGEVALIGANMPNLPTVFIDEMPPMQAEYVLKLMLNSQAARGA